ncbi:hypothetical protein BC937DRAFT_86839, partial [Endogone sp. FLAS-F59071]
MFTDIVQANAERERRNNEIHLISTELLAHPEYSEPLHNKDGEFRLGDVGGELPKDGVVYTEEEANDEDSTQSEDEVDFYGWLNKPLPA